MMYANKLAVALKANGKVLREMKSEGSDRDDTVRLPFGSEFSIYVKNMNSVRALVRIEIDGESITEGMSLIVEANNDIEIERFIKSRNMDTGLRFKFIERTQKIEDGPRGIKTEDGLIRVEYEFEREPAKIVPSPIYQPVYPFFYVDPLSNVWTRKEVHHHHHYDKLGSTKLSGTASDQLAREYSGTGDYTASNGVTYTEAQMKAPRSSSPLRSMSSSVKMSKSFGGAAGASTTAAVNNAFASAAAAPPEMSYTSNATMDCADSEVKTSGFQELNDKGITVGGSVSTQQFKSGAWFPTDGVKHVMIIKILGAVGEVAVTKPVTVKTKIECPTCGTKNKPGTKFCKECGTGLVNV